MIDYTLWEVIENGATLPKTTVVEGVEKMMPITSTEDKARRRLEVKARKKRFGRNAATKKTQRNLLKQQYENFTAPSSEMLDQTFDRLQKLASQLELLDEKLSQEDVNQKLLRSLSPEWNTLQAPRNQDNKNKESSRRSVPMETSTSTALVSCDGLGGYAGVIRQRKGLNIHTLLTHPSSSDSDAPMILHFPPPYTGNFMPPTLDLSLTGLDEFVNKPVVENSKAMSSKEEPKVVRKYDDAPSIEEWVLDDEEEDVSQPKIEKKTVRPSIVKKEFVKSKQQEKNAWKTVKQVDCNYHQKQFQNQRMVKLVWNNAQRVNHQNFAKKNHPCAKKNLVPRAVLMKSGLVSINTVRQNISKTVVLVNTARHINTAHSKTTVNAARPMPKAVVNAVKENNLDVVKALACWVWKLKHKVLDHVSKHNSESIILKEFDYIDAQGRSKLDKGVIDSGCSRHMTGSMSYLTNYEEIDGGYVAFGGNPKGEKIIGKVLLRVPRKNNMYSVDLKNIVPKGGLTCLFAKATSDESKLWHRRLGHLNFKTMNKLVKGNLVRGLPSKLFENDQTCVACQKGKQHGASCKSKTENSTSLPLHLLHMDLFGPTFVKSLMKKMYCLVVIDDYSRFTWVFFLATKDETSGILKSFITGIENLVDHKVKVIRCRTPQQNGVAKRRNRKLIEAARTMLADSKLPTTFWAEVVNTTCYVQNRVLVVKPHNKTSYELFHGRTPTLSFMRPFGCLVTILNTIDHLGKFDGKADEGFFIGYSLNSKVFRVFNSRTRIVEENLHIRFSKSIPNALGSGLDWLFNIDALTRTMNYEPIVAGTQSNGFVGTKESDNAGQARKEIEPIKDYILLPLWTVDPPYSQDPKSSHDDGSKPSSDDGKKVDEDPRKESECNDQEKEDNVNSTNNVNAAGTNKVNDVGGKTSIELPFDPNMPALEDYSIFDFSRDDEDDGAVADINNLDTTIQVSPIPTTRIHKDHPLNQVIRDLQSTTKTRKMSKNLEENGFVSTIQQRTNHKDLRNCLFACYLSQEEPKKVIHALKDPSWIEAMQEELL
ncbi:putative ribonuclease H-like domain-containing protein [Tanacetum coccineum]